MMMSNTNSAAKTPNTMASAIEQMMADWAAATPEQRQAANESAARAAARVVTISATAIIEAAEKEGR